MKNKGRSFIESMHNRAHSHELDVGFAKVSKFNKIYKKIHHKNSFSETALFLASDFFVIVSKSS